MPTSADRKMTAAEAAARLGIQRRSLYAYVSRGILHRTVAADGKTSLFEAAEVEALSRRRRGRPPAGTVDVMLSTSLTRIADDGVWFRETPLKEILGARWGFERTASWLWSVPPAGASSGSSSAHWPRPSRSLRDAILPIDATPTAVLLTTLAVSDRSHVDVADPVAVGRQLITDFADAAALSPVLSRRRVPVSATIAERMAIRFGCPALVETIDVMLTIMVDHELASSTLAARVAASTRGDAYAAVAAGLATLSGRLHGGVTRFSVELLADAAREGAATAVARRLAAGERVPGFGHAVYRALDPRAVLLFEHLESTSLPPERLMVAHEVMTVARSQISAHANIDLALASFVHAAELPAVAAEWIFATARTAGWIAHAIEEYGERPLRFRPRSVYVRPHD